MSTHYMFINGEIKKIIQELSSYTPSSEANWSGSALFAIKYVNLYQQTGSSNLIGWKLEVGSGILIYSVWQGLTLH